MLLLFFNLPCLLLLLLLLHAQVSCGAGQASKAPQISLGLLM